MKKLDQQSGKRRIEIQVGSEFYSFSNPHRYCTAELESELAELMYNSIRKLDLDICNIAENLNYKADNIKRIKDHVFYNTHRLDKYDEEIEIKRFDANLSQALEWKKLELGIFTEEDKTWLKHEFTKMVHKLNHDSGYTEAHDRAQTHFDGSPWDTKWNF